jgi:hypothetical protein
MFSGLYSRLLFPGMTQCPLGPLQVALSWAFLMLHYYLPFFKLTADDPSGPFLSAIVW